MVVYAGESPWPAGGRGALGTLALVLVVVVEAGRGRGPAVPEVGYGFAAQPDLRHPGGVGGEVELPGSADRIGGIVLIEGAQGGLLVGVQVGIELVFVRRPVALLLPPGRSRPASPVVAVLGVAGQHGGNLAGRRLRPVRQSRHVRGGCVLLTGDVRLDGCVGVVGLVGDGLLGLLEERRRRLRRPGHRPRFGIGFDGHLRLDRFASPVRPERLHGTGRRARNPPVGRRPPAGRCPPVGWDRRGRPGLGPGGLASRLGPHDPGRGRSWGRLQEVVSSSVSSCRSSRSSTSVIPPGQRPEPPSVSDLEELLLLVGQ